MRKEIIKSRNQWKRIQTYIREKAQGPKSWFLEKTDRQTSGQMAKNKRQKVQITLGTKKQYHSRGSKHKTRRGTIFW